jgi:integrase
VELLALTAQRREEVARLTWAELDLEKRVWVIPGTRTKNGKPHVVHLSGAALKVIGEQPRVSSFVFASGTRPFSDFTRVKRALDEQSGVSGWRLHDLRRTAVSGMARLGTAPHVADKILNHSTGAISGVAAVYQRHEFLDERRTALDCWGGHIEQIMCTKE